MFAHCRVTQGFGLYPVADGEAWIAHQEEFGFRAGLVQPAKLRKAGGEEAPRAAAVGFVAAQGLDGALVIARGVLCLAEGQVVPAGGEGVEAKGPADVLQAFVDTPGQYRDVGQRRPGVRIVRVELDGVLELPVGFGVLPFVRQQVGQAPAAAGVIGVDGHGLARRCSAAPRSAWVGPPLCIQPIQ